MALPFPTGPARPGITPEPGYPQRASHCQCAGGPTRIDGSDTCLRCGRLPNSTISETWAERAAAIPRRKRKRGRRRRTL